MKRAQFYFRQKCPTCEEAKAFLAENGVMVTERDIVKQPLRRDELRNVLGYHNPKYYLDTTSATYRKNRLDEKMPPLNDLLDMIIESPELLRHPIIVSGRLMTIGSGRQQLVDMFQINSSGNGSGNGSSKRA